MKRGSSCPVCGTLWLNPPDLRTCPKCPGVVLLAKYDYSETKVERQVRFIVEECGQKDP